MPGHDVALDYHRVLLGDATRMDAYDRAIRQVCRPGDVVLDVGTGTGVLAMLAARRGARVHAVEVAPVAAVARDLVRHNGLDHRVTVHHADLRTLDPVEPVDVVLGEYLGRFLVDDEMLDVVAAAHRWAKPDARWCPSRVALRLAPAASGLPQLHTFPAPLLGLDLAPAVPYTLHTCYPGHLGESALLGPPAGYVTWDLPGAAPTFDAAVACTLTRAGRLDALAGWFDATLCPTVTLSTRPGVTTHWGQYLFPVPTTEVEPGDVLEVHVRFDAGSGAWRWTGAVRRDGWTLRGFDLESDQRLGSRGPFAAPRPRAVAAVPDALRRARTADPAAARALLVQAARSLGPHEDALAAELYTALGDALVACGEPAAARTAYLRALDGGTAPDAALEGLRALDAIR